MKNRWIAAVVTLVLLALAGCAGNTVAPTDAKRMEELGQEFVEELETFYIPYRESADKLKAQEAVLVTDEKTYNINLLYTFHDAYRVGDNTQVTTVFKTKSFVVTRVVFESSAGYYFRYEYDPFNETEIVVSSQALDKVELKEDEKLNKVELTLLKDKKTPIVFSYKNLDDQNAEA